MDTIDPSDQVAPGRLPARILVSEKVETRRDRRSNMRNGHPARPGRPPALLKENQEETPGDEHLVDIVI
jgi:hypothetical protein